MSSQGNYPGIFENTFKQNKKLVKCYRRFGCVMMVLVPLIVIAVFIILIIKAK